MASAGNVQRTIGLTGAVVTLVGFVIGVSIFILPGTLAASTGPAIVFSYLLASLMAVFSCAISAQVGAVFPVSGASFVTVSRLVSPFWGFAAVWLIVGGGSIAVALLAYGFADYLHLIWPGVGRMTAAVFLVVALGGLNLMGARDTVLGQGLMVGAFMLALMVFSVAGIYHMDTRLLTPFVPNGLGPVLSATIPAFFSYAGFMVIIEIGGEIKRPARNIPLALGISFVTVLVVYTVVSLAIVGVVPWQELANIKAPVSEVAGRILPAWVASAITLTAVAAAASSVNVLLLGYSRDVLALARVKVLPEVLAKISKKHGEPINGVLVMMALSLAAVLTGGGIADFATLTVVGLLLFQIAVAAAVLMLPKKMKAQYEAASFSLKGWRLPFFSIGLMVFSAIFLIIVLLDSPGFILLAAAYFAIGTVYFFVRRAYLGKRGIRVQELIRAEVEMISVESGPDLTGQ